MVAQEGTFIELKSMQIACIKTVILKRTDVLPFIESLRKVCGDSICGPAMCIFHSGAVKDGFLVEAAFPVDRRIENDVVYTRTLEAGQAYCITHHGSLENIRETFLKGYAYTEAHARTFGGMREIYLKLTSEHPEDNVTEIQIIQHEWDRLLAQGVEQVLGVEARRQVMEGIEQLSDDSPLEMYTGWIQQAMQRIDSLTDDPDQKYRIVSCCAHVFPEERITHLRAIYEKTGEIDEVLREMYKDPAWYEDPVRKENVLHMRKVPFDPKTYAKATSPLERRKAYCHCKFVRPFLDETPSRMSPTFCWCGAGWYRRLWEGILGKPVKVEHAETLLQGNDQCTLRIILPLELKGGLAPETGIDGHG